MLNKKQLEDAAKCLEHPCSKCGLQTNAIYTCVESLAETALEYREMLKKIEFAKYGNYIADECIICGNARYQGHKVDCKLGNLLKESIEKTEKVEKQQQEIEQKNKLLEKARNAIASAFREVPSQEGMEYAEYVVAEIDKSLNNTKQSVRKE